MNTIIKQVLKQELKQQRIEIFANTGLARNEEIDKIAKLMKQLINERRRSKGKAYNIQVNARITVTLNTFLKSINLFGCRKLRNFG